MLRKVRKKAALNNITPKEEILQKLGKLIKEQRKKNGFTSFEDFAYQMEIARSLFYRYESGADLRVSTLFRIIEGMGMKVSDFFKHFD